MDMDDDKVCYIDDIEVRESNLNSRKAPYRYLTRPDTAGKLFGPE